MATTECTIENMTIIPPDMLYTFTLKGGDVFHGRFHQRFLKMKPAYMNGRPINLAMVTIIRMQRIEGPTSEISRRLRYFIFELNNGMKITGTPHCKICLVDIIIVKDGEVETVIRNCKIEFEHIVEVTQMV